MKTTLFLLKKYLCTKQLISRNIFHLSLHSVKISEIHCHHFLFKVSQILRETNALNRIYSKMVISNSNFDQFGAILRQKIIQIWNLESSNYQNQLRNQWKVVNAVNYRNLNIGYILGLIVRKQEYFFKKCFFCTELLCFSFIPCEVRKFQILL